MFARRFSLVENLIVYYYLPSNVGECFYLTVVPGHFNKPNAIR